MSPDEAIARVTKGLFLPVWLIIGEERVLRDQVVSAITKAALGNGLREFNHDAFTAGESAVEKILGATRTVPMMAPRRVVLVRSVERWDTASTASKSAQENATSSRSTKALAPLDALSEYAKTPVDSTTLLLLADSLDGRRKLVSVAKKEGFLVDCARLEARKLPEWLVERAALKGHPLARPVAELIAAIAGPDLSSLDDILERLSLYVGLEAAITEEAVAVNVTRVRLADTWSLVDAAATRNLGRLLLLFADVYDPRDRGLPLLGALAWSLRQLLKLQSALASGASLDDAARQAGIFPTFRAREHAQKLKAFRARELERWILTLQETDLALKSSRRPADAILEEMFVRLCRAA